MDDFKPNSHKSREKGPNQPPQKKQVNKVIHGSAKPKKKSEVKKFLDAFLSEDVDSVKSYILMDVLIPAVKKAVSDVVTNGLDMLLYGETGLTHKKTNSKKSYQVYYDKTSDRGNYGTSRRIGYSCDDIILESRGEAEEVLSRMDDLIATYGLVSVADLYDLVGLTGSYTDNKYGWTDIRSADVIRVRDGYMIRMPRALSLN